MKLPIQWVSWLWDSYDRAGKIVKDIRTQQTVGRIIDHIEVLDCFEKTLSRYKELNWDHLLPCLAQQPRMVIAKALAEHGQQFILDTGEIPNLWELIQAMPVSTKKYHLFALMANRNQGEEMKMYRFIFIREPQVNTTDPKWLLHSALRLSETEFNSGLQACLRWMPETYDRRKSVD